MNLISKQILKTEKSGSKITRESVEKFKIILNLIQFFNAHISSAKNVSRLHSFVDEILYAFKIGFYDWI